MFLFFNYIKYNKKEFSSDNTENLEVSHIKRELYFSILSNVLIIDMSNRKEQLSIKDNSSLAQS